MTQKDVCNSFLSHFKGRGNSLFSDGEKLLSYNTCIAQWYNGMVLFNSTKYSATTSRWQNYLLRRMDNIGIKYVELKDIDMSTINLINHYGR